MSRLILALFLAQTIDKVKKKAVQLWYCSNSKYYFLVSNFPIDFLSSIKFALVNFIK
jgi:hypothetical protein